MPNPISKCARGLERGVIDAAQSHAHDRRMSKTRTEVMAESRRKGVVAGVATAGTVALAAVGWPVTAVVAAVPAAVLGYRWWKHRAENGIKF